MLIYEHWLYSYFTEHNMKMKEMLSSHLYEMEMLKKNHLWCFKIHASFILISCYKSIACKQVTQMANYHSSSEVTSSSHAQTRLAWPLSNKTQMLTAQDIADDLSVFLNNTYILLRMYYCCKIECEVTMLS